MYLFLFSLHYLSNEYEIKMLNICSEQYVKHSNVQCQLNLINLPPRVKDQILTVLTSIYQSFFPITFLFM